jgi:hypothetical protein
MADIRRPWAVALPIRSQPDFVVVLQTYATHAEAVAGLQQERGWRLPPRVVGLRCEVLPGHSCPVRSTFDPPGPAPVP